MFDDKYILNPLSHLSHYEEKAQGPTITIVKAVLSTNEKIVEACKNLDDYAREYVPAPELSEDQKAAIEKARKEREEYRMLFDLGLAKPISLGPPPFKVRY